MIVFIIMPEFIKSKVVSTQLPLPVMADDIYNVGDGSKGFRVWDLFSGYRLINFLD